MRAASRGFASSDDAQAGAETMRAVVVIAWTTNTSLEATGCMERFDGYNYRPEYRVVPEPRAVVWTNDGGDAELQAARKYAASMDHDHVRVLTYPVGTSDPLELAKAHIMASLTSDARKPR